MARKSTQAPKRKPKAKKTPVERKAIDAAQYKRFVELARELGAEESPEAFERAFKKVARKRS